MAEIKPVYKKLSLKMFRPGEIITDRAGNVFVTRKGVCAVLGTNPQTLNTTYRAKGLVPVNRYIKKHKPYLLEDVEQAYNLRCK